MDISPAGPDTKPGRCELSWLTELFRKREKKERTQKRQYQGASTAPRLSLWRASALGPNEEVNRSLKRLRERARDLYRNNPHARKAINSLTSNLVGTGLRPIFRTGDVNLDEKAQRLWDRWARVAYTSSPLTFYGLQEVAVRAWLVDGEVLVRRRYRRVEDGLPVPLQLQLLEGDYLDETRDGSNGDRVTVGGIEFDQIGQRRAYWLFSQHPGEMFLQSFDSKAVPADAIAHLYQEIRPGQVRGVSWLAPVITALWDYGSYQDAERLRKRAEACVVAFVTGGNPEEAPSGELADGIGPTHAEDALGNPIEELSPGLVAYLPPYKDVRFHSPSATQGAAEYSKVMLHEIAAGLCIPYEILTGDLSEVNFTSMRMGMVEFRAMVRALRRHYLIPFLCQPILSWWVDAAVAAGSLPDVPALYEPRWSEPQIEEVDRLREAQADLAELRAGTSSWSEVVASKGKDPAALLEEIASERKKFSVLNVVFDSNPNLATASGNIPRSEGQPLDSPEGPGRKEGRDWRRPIWRSEDE